MNLKWCERRFSFLNSFPSHAWSCSSCYTQRLSKGLLLVQESNTLFCCKYENVYKMFTDMLDMAVLLEYISPLNACHIRFCNAYRCKGVNLKDVLFNVMRLHKSSKPIPGSVSYWNPVSAMEDNQALSMGITLLLQVLDGVPSSFTSQQGPLLLFSAWKGEFKGSLRAWGTIASC